MKPPCGPHIHVHNYLHNNNNYTVHILCFIIIYTLIIIILYIHVYHVLSFFIFIVFYTLRWHIVYFVVDCLSIVMYHWSQTWITKKCCHWSCSKDLFKRKCPTQCFSFVAFLKCRRLQSWNVVLSIFVQINLWIMI